MWILQCFLLMTAMLPHYPLLQPQDIQDICPHPHKPSQRRIQLLHAPCLTESCYEAHQCLALPRRNFRWKMRLAWAGKYRKTCRNIWDMNGRFWEALGGTWEDIENLTACGKCVDNRKKIMKRHAIILWLMLSTPPRGKNSFGPSPSTDILQESAKLMPKSRLCAENQFSSSKCSFQEVRKSCLCHAPTKS